MKTRKLTPTFVNRQIAKIDAMRERAMDDDQPLRIRDSQFDGSIVPYADVKRALKNRGDRRFVDGFWYGWVLAKGDQS